MLLTHSASPAWIGVIFTRFARATKRASSFIVADNALVAHRNGVPTLLIRLMNIRKHQLVDCSIRLYATIWDQTVEGEHICKFHQLKLCGGSGEADGFYIRPLLNLPW